MNIDISKIFEAFIELNKVKSSAPGDNSSSLARSIEFYKKRIKQINEEQPELLLPFLIKSHVQLVTIRATTSHHCHMLGDSVYFLERLISLSVGKYTQDIKESNDIEEQGMELKQLIKEK